MIHTRELYCRGHIGLDPVESDDNRFPDPKNKPSATSDTERPVYKNIWKCESMYHRREAGCWIDAETIDGMKKYLIIFLTYLISFVLFLPKTFVNEFIMVYTNRRIKGANIDFGGFLWFIFIWLLMTSNPGTKRAVYFKKNL